LGATGRTYTFPDAAGTVDLIAQTQTLTNKTIATGSNNITGEIGGASPSSGNIGEVVDSTLASGSAVSLTNNTSKTVTSITLTAGNWMIYGVINFAAAAGTTVTAIDASISPTTNTTLAAGTTGRQELQSTFATAAAQQLATGPTYVSINSGATYYLVGYSLFGVSTMTAYGEITAIRQP